MLTAAEHSETRNPQGRPTVTDYTSLVDDAGGARNPQGRHTVTDQDQTPYYDDTQGHLRREDNDDDTGDDDTQGHLRR